METILSTDGQQRQTHWHLSSSFVNFYILIFFSDTTVPLEIKHWMGFFVDQQCTKKNQEAQGVKKVIVCCQVMAIPHMTL
jgi:hypothetical protein